MQFTVKTLFAALTLDIIVIATQEPYYVPVCGQTILQNALNTSGCKAEDYKCICACASLRTAALAKLPKACSKEDLHSLLTKYNSQCKGMGGFVPLPLEVTY
ncbi:hypothetical protein E2P81_ATG06508 [Venturia nashicola]|uniref:CFEM domain-containing protein n=1 Tax=Venturia nashicola TaxID=86259 RepID=A0A4Z1PA98_9PEZI|nr:hypothetical protein E6O75_ATG06675 [Venturia nashicola]TLD29855.1 hypothetical protein E2P81_ATG06508 [Venturia nashicola]